MKNTVLFLFSIVLLAACGTVPEPFLADDIVVTDELIRYFKKNPNPSIVLKVQHIAEESVTNNSSWGKSQTHGSGSSFGIGLGGSRSVGGATAGAGIGIGASSSRSNTESSAAGHSVSRMQYSELDRAKLEFFDAFEKELIRNGFRVRDRKLAESLLNGKNFNDYHEIGRIMKADLILDISNIELIGLLNHYGQNVVYHALDFKLIIAEDAEIGGVFRLHKIKKVGRQYPPPPIRETASTFGLRFYGKIREATAPSAAPNFSRETTAPISPPQSPATNPDPTPPPQTDSQPIPAQQQPSPPPQPPPAPAPAPAPAPSMPATPDDEPRPIE